jgi:hypothetical protein
MVAVVVRSAFGNLHDIVHCLHETDEIVVNGLGRSWPAAG